MYHADYTSYAVDLGRDREDGFFRTKLVWLVQITNERGRRFEHVARFDAELEAAKYANQVSKWLSEGKRLSSRNWREVDPAYGSDEYVKRRIEEATKYADLDQLCLSPQCGFSSTYHGNALSIDDQWRKLERVVEVAREVWGD